jgi:hypothetical protein
MAAVEIGKYSTPAKDSPVRKSAGKVRDWLTRPRGLIVVAIAVIGAGLALGWNWVVAAGLAPLLLAVAPCAAMCALGLCMMANGNPSRTKQGATENAVPPISTP